MQLQGRHSMLASVMLNAFLASEAYGRSRGGNTPLPPVRTIQARSSTWDANEAARYRTIRVLRKSEQWLKQKKWKSLISAREILLKLSDMQAIPRANRAPAPVDAEYMAEGAFNEKLKYIHDSTR